MIVGYRRAHLLMRDMVRTATPYDGICATLETLKESKITHPIPILTHCPIL